MWSQICSSSKNSKILILCGSVWAHINHFWENLVKNIFRLNS